MEKCAQERGVIGHTMPEPPRLFPELSKNSHALNTIHTTGHVRYFRKFLHHIVQPRLSALQLVREIIQHARKGSGRRRQLVNLKPRRRAGHGITLGSGP